MDDSTRSTPENCEESEKKCSCGLTAKLRVSKTHEDPFRLFYNCPKNFSNQCEFFQWFDEPAPTGDAHTDDEVNRIRNECIRLQEKLDNERAAWSRKKSKLTSKLSRVQAELNDFKNIKRMANESELMPPVYGTPDADDDPSDAVEFHLV